MLFFLNDNIQHNKSGIEHAQIKRLHLFEMFDEPAKIVTRKYSNELHMVTAEAGIADEDFVNLFDYFQEARIFPQKDVTIKDLNIDPSWERKADGINYNYYRNGNRIMYVRRRNDKEKHIINLQYFDHFGKLLKVSWYDNRGFISVEQVYDWDGNIATENYLRPDGSIAIQLEHQKNKLNKVVGTYHLFNCKGQDYQVANLDELRRFFYDEIVTDPELVGDGPVGLVVDRTYEVGWSVLHMKHRVFRTMQLHNDHVNDNSDMLHSTLNYNYTWGLNHVKDWDGIITMTEAQAEMIRKRIGDKKPVYAINGVPVKSNNQRTDMKYRIAGQIIYVGRLGEDKQTGKLIEIFTRIHKKVPTAKLTLYGYGNPEDVNRYKKQVDDAGLTGTVVFAGYQVKLDPAYNTAQLFMDASRIDAQPLAMGEALSHGVPVVTYDYMYGPSEMVKSGVNGELVPLNNAKKMEKAAVDILTDPKLLQKLSTGAYDSLDAISNLNTWKQWNALA